MNDNDKKEFAEIMYALGENFNAQVTKPGLRIRFEALKQYSMEQVRAACVEVVRNRKFHGMPNVAEIVAAIGDRTEDRAVAQAHKVIECIRSYGAYDTPTFDDPVTNAVMTKRFRWQEVCQLREDHLKWFIKDFSEAYRSYSTEQTREMIECDSQKLKQLVENIG